MIRLGPADLDDYLRDDWMMRRLGGESAPFTSQRWMLESAPKRMIYARMYGDLFDGPRRRIADAGGGMTALTRDLATRHDYTLIDVLAHDTVDSVRAVERDTGARFLRAVDWYQFSPEGAYDVVLANDLFPNVDQRLELFLAKFLPCCRELRVLVTYHNAPRFHTVKRVDADEVMCMLAWTGRDVSRALEPQLPRMLEPRGLTLDALADDAPSLFDNRRQVALVRLRGDVADGEGGRAG